MDIRHNYKTIIYYLPNIFCLLSLSFISSLLSLLQTRKKT